MTRYKKMIVHGSKPHTDDAMCAALAKILNPDIIIERCNEITDEMKNDPEVIICDIGGGKYDHHQEDVKLHEDGTKYAACTLLFEDFKDQLFKTENGKENFEKLLRILEYTDNTGNTNLISMSLNKLTPTWNETSFTDEDAFFMMVDKLKAIIEAQIAIEENLLFKILGKKDELIENDKLIHLVQNFFQYSISMLGIEHLENITPNDNLSHYEKYTCPYEELLEDFGVEEIPFFGYFICDKYDLEYDKMPEYLKNEIESKNNIVNAPEPIVYALCALLYKDISPKLILQAIKTNDQELITENETFIKNRNNLIEQLGLINDRGIAIQNAKLEADKLLIEKLIPESKNFILELEFGIPWKIAAQNHNILFAILPDERTGGYMLQSSNLDRNTPIIRIPQDTECNYVHHSGHLAVFETKEEALECAKLLIDKHTKDKSLKEILDIFCDYNSTNLYSNLGGILRGIKLYMELNNLTTDEMIEEVKSNISNFNDEFKKAVIHTMSLISEQGIFSLTKQDLISEYKKFFTFNTTLNLSDGTGYVFDPNYHYNYEKEVYENNTFSKLSKEDFKEYKQNLLEILYEQQDTYR